MAKQWYFLKGQQQFGPISWGDLYLQAKNGNILFDDLVWADGMPQWIPASQVKGLIPAPVAPPPPPPKPTSSQAPPPPPAAPPPPLSAPYAPPVPPAKSGVAAPSHPTYGAPAAPPMPLPTGSHPGYQHQGYVAGYGAPHTGKKRKGGLIAIIAFTVLALAVGTYFLLPIFLGWNLHIGSWHNDDLDWSFHFDKNNLSMLDIERGVYFEVAYRIQEDGNRKVVEYYDELDQKWVPMFAFIMVHNDLMFMYEIEYGDRLEFWRISNDDYNALLIGAEKVNIFW